MTYWMFDTRGRGDSGNMSQALVPNKERTKVVSIEDAARPRVGVAMRVGSMLARSMQAQDWWMTTPIVEIVSDTPEEVVFKTKNSTYTWKII